MDQLSSLGPRLAIGGTGELFGWDDGRVLKLYWHGAAMDAAEREAERTRAAHAAGAPTPRVFDVITVDERPGVVFERLDGPSMLQAIGDDPGKAELFAQQLATLHAQLHAHAGIALPPQREHLIRRVNLGPLPARNKPLVLSAMRRLPDGEALCHGDFHPGNVLMTKAGPRIIDWFDATAGDPGADFARTCLLLQYSRLPGTANASAHRVMEALRERFLDAYIERYRALRPATAETLVEWFLPVAGARVAEPIPAQERTTLLRVIGSLLPQA